LANFSGSGDEVFEDWCRHLELALDHDPDRFRVGISLLRGTAFDAVKGQLGDGISTFKQLKEELHKQFGSLLTRMEHLNNLYLLQLGDDLTDFIARFRALAYRVTGPPLQDFEMVAQFFLKLPEKLKNALNRSGKVFTFPSLIQEVRLTYDPAVHGSSRSGVPPPRLANAAPKDDPELNAFAKVHCDYCETDTHATKDCRTLARLKRMRRPGGGSTHYQGSGSGYGRSNNSGGGRRHNDSNEASSDKPTSGGSNFSFRKRKFGSSNNNNSSSNNNNNSNGRFGGGNSNNNDSRRFNLITTADPAANSDNENQQHDDGDDNYFARNNDNTLLYPATLGTDHHGTDHYLGNNDRSYSLCTSSDEDTDPHPSDPAEDEDGDYYFGADPDDDVDDNNTYSTTDPNTTTTIDNNNHREDSNLLDINNDYEGHDDDDDADDDSYDDDGGADWTPVGQLCSVTADSEDQRPQSRSNAVGLVRIPVKVNFKPAMALLDTGAEETVLAKAFVDKHKLPVHRLHRPVKFICANGSSFHAEFSFEGSLLIGGYHIKHTSFKVLPIEHDVILGLDFLRRHDPLVNWRLGTLRLRVPDSAHDTALEMPTGPRHLYSLDERTGTYDVLFARDAATQANALSASGSLDLARLLERCAGVFVESDTLPDLRPGFDHTIITNGQHEPPHSNPYRHSPEENEEEDRQLDKMLAKGQIIPSTSSYASPVLFARKKNGTLRMCVDYRRLNAMTQKMRYPLPNCLDLFDKLHGARFFSKIDLRSGYHQLRMEPRDQHKTAFITRRGLFEFQVLPFGLCNAPASFQRLMSATMRKFDKFCAVYLDDVLIFSKTEQEHLKHVRLVLEELMRNGFCANNEKCAFGRSHIEFLGFFVSHDKVEVDPAKVSGINNWQPPTNRREMMRFLGVCNFLRRFVQDFARTATPLTALTRKDQPFVWSNDAQRAFERLKRDIAAAPALRIPSPDGAYVVNADASDLAIGAVLYQNGLPVAFESRKLTSAEINYPTRDKELLAVIHSLTVWRPYLLGAQLRVTINTDHRPLTHIFTQKTIRGRWVRWLEILSEYNLDIRYVPGSQQVVADGLSRSLNAVRVESPGDDTMLSAGPVFLDKIRQSLTSDKTFRRVVASPGVNFLADDGLLYYKSGHGLRLCIPEALRRELVITQHELLNHAGKIATAYALRHRFYWPSLFTDVEKLLRTCAPCQFAKSSTHASNGLVQPLPIPHDRWEEISLDYVTALPTTKDGNDALLVVVDRLTKRVRLIPTTTKVTAKGTADLIFAHVFALFGLPKVITSDRDARFTSDVWTQLFARLGTKLQFTTAYHPRGRPDRARQQDNASTPTHQPQGHNRVGHHATPHRVLHQQLHQQEYRHDSFRGGPRTHTARYTRPLE
jgi:hypothetical protein